MNHYFITGTSRGIGKSLAVLLLKNPENQVTGLSRTCAISHERYTHIDIDLADLKQVNAWKFPELNNPGKIVLVNNAGAVGTVRYAGRMEEASIERVYNLNLITPTLLTNAFLRAYDSYECEQVILNVSSGAGKNPIDGWSVYCATKAGLDHFSRTVDAEIKHRQKKNVHLFSVAPGIVDTAMQEEIRSASILEFSRLQQFVDYKISDQLAHPDLIARKYLAILDLPKKFGEVVFSVKDVEPASE